MKIIPIIIKLISITISLAGIIVLQEQLLKKDIDNSLESYKTEEKSDQLFLRLQTWVPTLGFDNIVADWSFLQFIQYFGDTQARKQTSYALIPQFFELIVKNNPRFVNALLILSSANSLYAVSPQITVKLLEQALQKLSPQVDPLAPYVWTYKGVDEILFLGETKAAQHSYEMAAKWAQERGDNLVAQRNRETAYFLAKNPDSKNARVTAWMSILSGAITDDTRQRAIKEIIALGGKIGVNPQGDLVIDFPEKG